MEPDELFSTCAQIITFCWVIIAIETKPMHDAVWKKVIVTSVLVLSFFALLDCFDAIAGDSEGYMALLGTVVVSLLAVGLLVIQVWFPDVNKRP